MWIKKLVRKIKDALAEAQGQFFSTNKWLFLAPITVLLAFGTLYQSIRIFGFADGIPYIVLLVCVILLMFAEMNYSDLPWRNLSLVITFFAFLTMSVMGVNFGYLTWMSREIRAIEREVAKYDAYKTEDDKAIEAWQKGRNESGRIVADIAKAEQLSNEARDRETRRLQGVVNSLANNPDLKDAAKLVKSNLRQKTGQGDTLKQLKNVAASLLSDEDTEPARRVYNGLSVVDFIHKHETNSIKITILEFLMSLFTVALVTRGGATILNAKINGHVGMLRRIWRAVFGNTNKPESSVHGRENSFQNDFRAVAGHGNSSLRSGSATEPVSRIASERFDVSYIGPGYYAVARRQPGKFSLWRYRAGKKGFIREVDTRQLEHLRGQQPEYIRTQLKQLVEEGNWRTAETKALALELIDG